MVLDLQFHPIHMLPQFIDEVGVGLGCLIVLVPGLGDSWVGQHASFPSLSSRRHFPKLLRLAHTMQLPITHTSTTISSVFPR